ncbi:MAG: glutathione S-transferase family protein [Pseudomonadota bacterium]|jgi:glutathione S-transferase|uniref:Glutathione S-transferase n=1 Tax=Caballeronia sordidicola TaxID=196367 RepID=A0A242MU94_CABSO|nr:MULTISPECIES: glutathione S-transferase family protein [Burkholderiaceae]AMM15206.1 glutathione S-transferase [Burkholderia sp. PAMC 28687]MDP9155206.1 glutathione S-transferase family protein [Pseudomonadota bacterium]OTP75011.1 Glutathione S-transferase [Caballeronia sordidicola]
MKLVIGDKNQSSWSMRPWLVLKHFGIPFEEVLIRLGQPDSTANILAHSPSGKVPCLVTDAGDAVWESLAIMETLAELFPQHAMWPRDAAARAHARSISAEMHAGFGDLREQMSMNIQRQAFGQPLTAGALSNVKRIDKIWSNCLSAHGGPFLFGKEFGIADAMFAPVVMRFNSYAPKISDHARDYCKHITTMPEVAEWIEGARKEQ